MKETKWLRLLAYVTGLVNQELLLAAIETSTEKIKTLEADLATERENGKSLVEQYRSQSADALKTLGIADEPQKQRKPRSTQAILISAASRSIRQTVRGGEKNAKTILAAALDRRVSGATIATVAGNGERNSDLQQHLQLHGDRYGLGRQHGHGKLLGDGEPAGDGILRLDHRGSGELSGTAFCVPALWQDRCRSSWAATRPQPIGQ